MSILSLAGVDSQSPDCSVASPCVPCSLPGGVPSRRVHAQEAPAKIDNALVAVGEELRFDLVKTAPGLGDDAGLAQNGEMFRDQRGWETNAFGNLDDHQLVATGELAQDGPAPQVADGGKSGF